MSGYGRLANLSDEPDVKPGSGYSRLSKIDDAERATPEPQQEDAPRSLADEFKRQAGLTFRAAVQGVASIPLAAADFGTGVRNLITGEGLESPSAQWNRNLTDLGVPEPRGATEKVSNFVASALAGAAIPAPRVPNAAPAGFVRPMSQQAAALQSAREAGYAVPPVTANPNLLNKAAEGFAGKASTAQAASIKNQQVTNALARQALGLAEDTPITSAVLKNIRTEAGKVYDNISNAGEINTDTQYLDDLVTLGKGADEIAQAFPGANVGATKQIGELVDSLLQTKFDSKAALQYLRELRKQSSGNLSGINAADPSKQALGMAQREAASILEDQIERHLSANGMEDVASAFAGARKTIAISHTVENALNDATGNVVAGKLGQQFAKGKPLSGELETVARFSRAFPKASKEITESMPGISPLDVYASSAASFLSGQPLLATYPLLRMGARNAIISDIGQRIMTEPGAVKPDAITLGLLPSTLIQGANAIDR